MCEENQNENSFTIQSSNKYLISAYYVPGTLEDSKQEARRTEGATTLSNGHPHLMCWTGLNTSRTLGVLEPEAWKKTKHCSVG
jgi:hypothetical protein